MKKFIKIIVLIAVIALFIVLRNSPLGDVLTLENLQENKDTILQMVEENFLVSALLYVGIYVIVAAFSIPGATVLTLAGGFIFGAVMGTLFVNIGATLGALGAFFFARYVIGDWVQSRYEDRLKKFNEELNKNGGLYLLTLRFIPIFPFFLINLFAGITKLRTWSFIWTTSIGILPGSFVYAYAGRQLSTIESLKDIFTVEILFAFILLGVLALIPILYQHRKKLSKKMGFVQGKKVEDSK